MSLDAEHNKFRPIVGIDLGTTNSAIAYIRAGRPEIIASPRGERITPSVVMIDLAGQVAVGEAARASLVAMPDRTVAAVKRKMGSAEPLSIAGQALLPEEISALILKELKGYADAALGEGEKEAVITVPAYFTDEQRRATKRAGELAGFAVERIINEPTAAALAYGLDHLDDHAHVLVYDLGGGTFDVSVCELMGGVLEVQATTGNRQLGGEDFDWRLVDLFAARMIAEHGVDPRLDIRAKALLKEEAERVKKRLSAEATASVSLPLVTVKDDRPVGLHVAVSREEFETLIDDLLAETMESVRTVLADARLAENDVDEILLVGGSTRIVRVQSLMQAFFGRPARVDINPDEAVALGATVQAGLKSGALSASGLVVTDVAPFSMGIAVLKHMQGRGAKPGAFSVVIPRNTTIPVTKSERYFTTFPGQTQVAIEIYQGENDWVKYNHSLGEFLLEGIPENLEETEEIQVQFRYNLNGILDVSATSAANGQTMRLVVQDALQRDSQEAFEESRQRIDSLGKSAPETDDDEDLDDAWLEESDLEDDGEWNEILEGDIQDTVSDDEDD